MKEGPRTDRDRLKASSRDYLRYSAIGLQMMGIILAGVWAGRKLDQWLHHTFPGFTLGLSLLAIAGAMVFLFKETNPRR
ncbi:MAG: AtpZ/AtpI family protein [Flavobacteriales bacterium]|nr:AtpZ/AtpI family protein [Flavobacteriales bacterium]